MTRRFLNLNPIPARSSCARRRVDGHSVLVLAATVGSIVETLLVEFDAERDVLWRDLSAVIESLRPNALLEVLPPGTE